MTTAAMYIPDVDRATIESAMLEHALLQPHSAVTYNVYRTIARLAQETDGACATPRAVAACSGVGYARVQTSTRILVALGVVRWVTEGGPNWALEVQVELDIPAQQRLGELISGASRPVGLYGSV